MNGQRWWWHICVHCEGAGCEVCDEQGGWLTDEPCACHPPTPALASSVCGNETAE